MPFLPEILWTDGLLFSLLFGSAVLIWYIRRREHLCAPWRRFANSKMGIATGVVLIVYSAVGILDSLHFRVRIDASNSQTIYSSEVLSALDTITKSLRDNKEKSYSAPFAYQLYTKDTIETSDGRQIRDYPRLKYGGAHLADAPRERTKDVVVRALLGLLIGLSCWGMLTFLLVSILAKISKANLNLTWKRIWRGESEFPWCTAILTCAILFLLLSPLIILSSTYHVFGTDKVGQDVLYLSLKSIRTGLLIGTLTTMVMLPLALLLGIMAGYFRGRVDDIIQWIYTTLSSIPGVLLIAATVLMTQVYMETHAEQFGTVVARADFRLLFLCVILGMTSWTGLCRLLRGETLKLRELEYIQAARAFGVGHWRTITRHILPNVMHIVLISVVLDFSGLVLAEAVLSYVGVGVDPSTESWGNMINNARLEMAREPVVWWSLAAAFLFMLVFVLAANLFADAVRDAFDPRNKWRSTKKKLSSEVCDPQPLNQGG